MATMTETETAPTGVFKTNEIPALKRDEQGLPRLVCFICGWKIELYETYFDMTGAGEICEGCLAGNVDTEEPKRGVGSRLKSCPECFTIAPCLCGTLA